MTDLSTDGTRTTTGELFGRDVPQKWSYCGPMPEDPDLHDPETDLMLLGPHIYVVDQGFVFWGNGVAYDEREVLIQNASCIRKWGTKKGIGQLTHEGRQPESEIDRIGAMWIPHHVIISTYDVDVPDQFDEGVDIDPQRTQSICIVQNGFVFCGNWTGYWGRSNACVLTDASTIRNWGTDTGIGQLALEGRRPQTELDYNARVVFPYSKLIARIPVVVDNLIETENVYANR